MTKQTVHTHSAPPPAGPYSQGIVANGFVFLSGQGPNTAAGEPISGGFAEQARQTFDNLAAVAAEAGATLEDVVRVGVYLRDMANFAEMNEIYAERFGPIFPARTTIQSDLPGFEIEVDAVLLLPSTEAAS